MVPAGKTKKVFDGRYEILAIVGRGARSVVYHARLISNPSLEVALKVLAEREGEPSIRDKLKREALAMVSCRHPYVVRLDDFNSLGNLSYFAMEYASEGDLSRFIASNGGSIPHELGAKFLSQCAHALAHIHECSVVHRDIKPENILVTGQQEIRIADFGIAMLPGEDTSIEELESGVGTMDYMSPELLEGKKCDASSDVYSLGLVFYEALTGTHPFRDAPLIQQLDLRRDEMFPHASDTTPSLPRGMGDIIMRCLRYDPMERFANGRALLNALESLSHIASRIPASEKPIANDEDLPLEVPVQHTPPPPPPTAAESRPQTESRSRFRLKERQGKVKVREFDAESGEVSSKPPMKEPESVTDTMENVPHPAQERSSPEIDPYLSPPASLDEPSSYSPGGSHSDQFARQRTIFIEPDERSDLAPEPPPPGRSPRASLIAAGLVVVTLALLVLGGNFIGGVLYERSGLRDALRSIFGGKTIERLIPSVAHEPLAFPNLPSGMYVGSISGIFPGRTAPLTLVSFRERQEIAVIVGIEGWTPVSINVAPPSNEDSSLSATQQLRVASNGVVLKMTGQEVEGELVGYFSDAIHGTTGEWRAAPIRLEREEEE